MITCPSTRDGQHKYTFTVGSGVKSDFEPVEYGRSAEETLYRRVEYSYLACPCGEVRKARVIHGSDL